MPKKKAATKKATAKKAPKKKTPAPEAEHVDEEITLEPIEEKAFHLAHTSAKVQRELEEAVTDALGKSVRKVFKNHRIDLTPAQATNMAMILFGD
jgi:hypothetical protein